MPNQYEKLISQGVPPQVAAQTIYDNMTKQQGGEPAPQPAAPAPKTKKRKKNRPTVEMAKEPSPDAPRTAGRPPNPLSRQRMLCSVLLAQAYQISDVKTLTEDQLRELMGAAYAKVGSRPKFPSESSFSGIVSKLRNGEVKGFPAMEVEGPLSRTWGGKFQQVVKVHRRDRQHDISSGVVDLTLIPKFVFQ